MESFGEMHFLSLDEAEREVKLEPDLLKTDKIKVFRDICYELKREEKNNTLKQFINYLVL